MSEEYKSQCVTPHKAHFDDCITNRASLWNLDLARPFKSAMLMLGLFPFFRVPLVISMGGDSFINLFTLIASVVAAASMLSFAIQNRSLPSPFLLILAFELTVLPFSRTFGFDEAVFVKFYATALYQIAYCWFIYLLIKNGDTYWISAMSAMFFIIIAVNLLTIIMFPEGMPYSLAGEPVEVGSSSRNWLLGYANNHAVFFIYGILFSMLNAYRKIGKQISVFTVVLYAMCLFSTLAVESRTSLVAMMLLGIILIAQGWPKKLRISSMKFYLVVYLVIWLAVIFLGTGALSFSSVSTWLVESVLHKDVSFTGRADIWSNALTWISTYPILGNGAESYGMHLAKIGVENDAHNEVLNIFYEGGLVHFAMFVGLLGSVSRSLSKYKDSKISHAISVAIFLMLILQLMRGCVDLYWLSMYLLAAQVGVLIEQMDDQRKSKLVRSARFKEIQS